MSAKHLIPTTYTIDKVKIWLIDGDSFTAEIDDYEVGRWISLRSDFSENILIPWSSVVAIRSEPKRKERGHKA